MKRNNGTLVTRVLEKVAKQLGAEIHIEPTWGYVGQLRLPDGRTRYFRNTNLDLNGLGASEIARDKAYAEYFMKHLGYPVIPGRPFFTRRWSKVLGTKNGPDAAYRYATQLGFPVIVKPNSKSQGTGVYKAYNRTQFLQAMRHMEAIDRVFLVQRVVEGHDYRIVVLDGEVISAYERVPLRVLGDGRSTIRQLLQRKQRDFIRAGRDTTIVVDDPRITHELRRQRLTRGSIPADGAVIQLLPNANLSSGGDAIDVTSKIHPTWRTFAKKIANDMNLRYIGIDVMSHETLDRPTTSFVVIEVNAAPGLDNYATIGKDQERIVEQLYRKVLEAMLK